MSVTVERVLRELIDRHPHHTSVPAVMRCPRCMGDFWARMDRRRVLDAQGERP
jgi:hypothetical protein